MIMRKRHAGPGHLKNGGRPCNLAAKCYPGFVPRQGEPQEKPEIYETNNILVLVVVVVVFPQVPPVTGKLSACFQHP